MACQPASDSEIPAEMGHVEPKLRAMQIASPQFGKYAAAKRRISLCHRPADQALGHTIGLSSSTVAAGPPEWPVRKGEGG